MSNQSGIKASQELLDAFAQAGREGNTRVIRVSIKSESLVPDGASPVSGDWEADFRLIQEHLEPKKPSYVLYRFDSRSASGGDFEWLFNCYVPDDAHVREKMLYASTRATLIKDLGDYRFKDSVYGSHLSEFTREGYDKHVKHQKSAAPLTEREKEIEQLKKTEHGSDIGTSTRQSHVSGVSFPFQDVATEALKKLSSGEVNTVILHIDMSAGESVALDAATNYNSTAELNAILPNDFPRYVFYKPADSVIPESARGKPIFLYSCPSQSKVRERMLYSSCRSAVLREAESAFGEAVRYRLELDDPTEFTDEYIQQEIRPEDTSAAAAVAGSTQRAPSNGSPSGTPLSFRKPAPPGRGRTRIHNAQNAQ